MLGFLCEAGAESSAVPVFMACRTQFHHTSSNYCIMYTPLYISIKLPYSAKLFEMEKFRGCSNSLENIRGWSFSSDYNLQTLIAPTP